MGRAKFTLVNPADGGKGVLFKDVAGMLPLYVRKNNSTRMDSYY